MKKKHCLFDFCRFFALLLAILLCISVFAGCRKTTDIEKPSGRTVEMSPEGTLEDGKRATFSGILEPAEDGYTLTLERAENYYLSVGGIVNE